MVRRISVKVTGNKCGAFETKGAATALLEGGGREYIAKQNTPLPKTHISPTVNAFGQFNIDGVEQTAVLADAEQTRSILHQASSKGLDLSR